MSAARYGFLAGFMAGFRASGEGWNGEYPMEHPGFLKEHYQLIAEQKFKALTEYLKGVA